MTMKLNKQLIAICLTSAIVSIPQMSFATEGYFQHGWGTRHSALAGAGIADITDASGQAINPAGLLGSGNELNIAATIFNPNRQYTGSGEPGFSSQGKVESDSKYFIVPNVAYSSQIDEHSAWGITMYGNGGMNTDYPAVDRALEACGGGSGIFCGGKLGVDLVQAFISPGYAYKSDNITYGIAPILAIQSFESNGLVAFSGFSSDAEHLTDNGHDTVTGFGLKVGIQLDMDNDFSIALAYQPKIDMDEFEDYAGLFADGGDFDIPSNLVFGVAFDAADNVRVMFDYKKINYSDVGSINNSGTFADFQMGATGPGNPLGSSGGPGFGWDDVTAVKLGVEWKQSEDLTWRFGYATNDQPMDSDQANFNILAPGVVSSHISIGLGMALEDGDALEFSFTYVPNDSVTGPGMINPNHVVKIEMDQLIFGVSYTISFND